MNNAIAILSWIIYGIGRIHYNTFKTAATTEAVISQTRDGVGNIDGVQTAATIEAVISQTRDGVGNFDGGQTAATSEALISHTRDGVGNGDGGQTVAVIVSIISWLSILYALNGRKVTVWILFRYEKVKT